MLTRNISAATSRLASLLVHVLHRVSSDASLDIAAEMFLVSILIFLDEMTHVVSHVRTENMSAMNVSSQRLRLSVITRESLLGMRNVQSTVNSSFHGTEHPGASRGPGQANVKTGTESTGTIVIVLDTVHLSINLGLALVHRVQLELLENPSGQQ